MYIPHRINGTARSTQHCIQAIEAVKKQKFDALERLRHQFSLPQNRANALATYPPSNPIEKRYANQALPLIAKFAATLDALERELYEVRHQPPSEVIPILQSLYDTLPEKPYTAEQKGSMSITSKKYAWNKELLQVNHPAVCGWLVFDIDDPNALYAHEDNHAPAPQYIVVNPANGHAHLFYRLTTPVGKWGASSDKAVMYLTAVYAALARKLGADSGYIGNIAKNPNSQAWHTYTTDAPESYTLGDLADWLDLPSWSETAAIRKQGYDTSTAVGRNVALFHGIRKRCYSLADQYSGRKLYREIVALADQYNATFEEPLPSNEIVNTCRSIYHYCSSSRFKAHKAKSDARFSALQAQRGAKSKRPPSATSERTTQPWLALGISRATYYNRKKAGTL